MPHASVHHVHATGLQPCASCLLTCPTASPSCVWGGLHATGAPCPVIPSPPPLTTSCRRPSPVLPLRLVPHTAITMPGALLVHASLLDHAGWSGDGVGGGPVTPWPPFPLSHPSPPVSSPSNPTPPVLCPVVLPGLVAHPLSHGRGASVPAHTHRAGGVHMGGGVQGAVVWCGVMGCLGALLFSTCTPWGHGPCRGGGGMGTWRPGPCTAL